VADVEARIVVANVDEARAVLELAEKALESTRLLLLRNVAKPPETGGGRGCRVSRVGRRWLRALRLRRLALLQSSSETLSPGRSSKVGPLSKR